MIKRQVPNKQNIFKVNDTADCSLKHFISQALFFIYLFNYFHIILLIFLSYISGCSGIYSWNSRCVKYFNNILKYL